MCVAATARRRRSQAVNGYKHLAPLLRPRYKKPDKIAAAKRLAHLIAVERRMSQGKKKK